MLWFFAAIFLTYTEQFAIDQAANPRAFWSLFVSVFILNTGFAIDGYIEAKKAIAAKGG